MHSLITKINTAPCLPGCYLYKNKIGRIIYIGKAKHLRNRVRQYFRPSTIVDNPKLQGLVKAIVDVEYRITETELDALLLEYQLIKKYKPWYNSQFIQDLQHPLIKITIAEEYPTITLVYEKDCTSAFYLDCFSNEGNAIEAIAVINAVWKTPLCRKQKFLHSDKPCMYYHIGKCLAPCAKKVSSEVYRKQIISIEKFFSGKKTTILSQLRKQMQECAAALQFEKAASLKQQAEALLDLQQKSKRMFHFPAKQDVILLIRVYHSSAVSLFYIRDKAVVGRLSCFNPLEKSTLSQFIEVMYVQKQILPNINTLEALTEIIADRKYLILPRKSSKELVIKKIVKAYQTFMTSTTTNQK